MFPLAEQRWTQAIHRQIPGTRREPPCLRPDGSSAQHHIVAGGLLEIGKDLKSRAVLSRGSEAAPLFRSVRAGETPPCLYTTSRCPALGVGGGGGKACVGPLVPMESPPLVDGGMHRAMDACMHGAMDGWEGWWVGGLMDEWMDAGWRVKSHTGLSTNPSRVHIAASAAVNLFLLECVQLCPLLSLAANVCVKCIQMCGSGTTRALPCW